MVSILSKIVTALLWLATLSAAFVWAFVPDPPFEPEPMTVILGLICGAVTGLMNEYSRKIEEEEYSVAYALAYGYVNNFVEPVITQVLASGNDPKLYIFIPEKLSDLEPKSVERYMAVIRQQFKSHVVQLEMKEGRARDVITIMKHDEDPHKILFDFPNTLLTLNTLVDYKVESRGRSFSLKAKEALASSYIGKFREAIATQVSSKGIAQHVAFVDKHFQLT